MDGRTAQAGGKILGLDGLRAVSIGLVLAAHCFGTRGYPSVPGWLHPLARNGALGVSVFFVISGFLITTLLVREQERTGTIGLGQFYLRRVLRIFPAYYLYLLVVAGLWLAGTIAMPRGELFSALTYTRNFYRGGSWFTGHAWSLAIEEQFYMLWPLVLLRVGPKRGLHVAAGVVAAGPVIRVLTWVGAPSLRGMVDTLTFTRIDSIMVGCLLALLCERPRFLAAMRGLHARGGALLAIGAIVASVYARAWTPWEVVASYSVEAIAAAVVLHWCVTHPAGRVGRVLELAPVRWVGEMSYSLYLWQQLFLNRDSDFVLSRFPLNLACAFLAAMACRAVCEKPFLKLKDKISARAAARVPVRPVVGRPSLPV